MRYEGHAPTNPLPSQTGWLFNLRALHHVGHDLKQAGFTFMKARSYNQDPLENLNGLIIANCGGNSNPTTAQFVGGYKTAIINNFSHGNLRGTNCEYDYLELLTDMNEFLTERRTRRSLRKQ